MAASEVLAEESAWRMNRPGAVDLFFILTALPELLIAAEDAIVPSTQENSVSKAIAMAMKRIMPA
jgi:hypothetical protein